MFKRLRLYILVIILLTLNLVIKPCTASPLGPAEIFNVYSLSGITYSESRFEGITGAAGNINLENFSIADQIGSFRDYVLYAGGNVNFSSGSNFFGGIEAGGDVNIDHIYVQGSISSGGNVVGSDGTIEGSVNAQSNASIQPTMYVDGGTNQGVPYTSTVDHNSIRNALLNASTDYASQSATSGYTMPFGEIVLEGTSGLNIFDITASDIDTAWGIEFNGPSDATFVLNISGIDVNIESMGFDLQGGASMDQILYNAFEATRLEMAYIGLPGTVLAPLADTNFLDGVVLGSLYVGDLSGLGPSAEPEAVPEPSTILLLVIGLAVMVWIKRKLSSTSTVR